MPALDIHADPPLKLLRTAVRGADAFSALYTCADAGVDVTMPWFEPRFWIARDAVVDRLGGRGEALLFRHEQRQFVLRHYRRGGLVARFTDDRYLWLGEERTRPLAELKILLRLHAAGLPVPRPIAARHVRQGAWYRADLVTEYLPDTQTLAARLERDGVGLATWAAIGRCIRRFHDYGLCHADLNAHNILLRDEDEVFLVDFDRARRRRPGLWRDANLVRLRRSLDALEDRRATPRFDDTQWQCLLTAWF